MSRQLYISPVLAFFLFFGWNMEAAEGRTRVGSAAYHAHSSRMVTCARYEPVGSILRVTNRLNGKTITVTVNCRGPYNGNRILDLSTGAFRKLFGSLKRGVGPISYVVVRRGKHKRHQRRKR